MKLPCDIRGFTISASYKSRVTGRTCATIQGVEVTHPQADAKVGLLIRTHSRSPLGSHANLTAAVKEIEQQYQHAHAPEHAFTLCTYQPSYVERLALWWPDALNPPKALAEMVQRAAEDAAAEKSRRAEVAAKLRLVEAAPNMLAALKRAKLELQSCQSGGEVYESVCAAIDKAEKG